MEMGEPVRLPDPGPDEWLTDFMQPMKCTQSDRVFGPDYGNFWARWPCLLRRHRWAVLMRTDEESGYPREVRRCQRCGSQVHQSVMVTPPRRGRI
jgi:hypothetical protein